MPTHDIPMGASSSKMNTYDDNCPSQSQTKTTQHIQEFRDEHERLQKTIRKLKEMREEFEKNREKLPTHETPP